MEFVVLAFVVTGVLAPLWVAVRSRRRVRALMAAEAEAPRTCTIPRARVEQFHAATRVLQGLGEGLLDQIEHGYETPHTAFRLTDDIGTYSRALAEWLMTYDATLDEEDRAALADRGISAEWLSSFREAPDENGVSRLDKTILRRHATELARIEALMCQSGKLSAYR